LTPLPQLVPVGAASLDDPGLEFGRDAVVDVAGRPQVVAASRDAEFVAVDAEDD
jgi:hypothetical protein